MKTTSRLLVVLCLLLGIPAAGQDNAADWAARRPTAADFPEADGVVLYEKIVISVDLDGRMSRRCHRISVLFTELAINDYCDPRIEWRQNEQELIVHRCRTYPTAGPPVDTKSYGFNEVTPWAIAACPGLLQHRETVISHVAVERGAILELDYEIRDRQPGPWWLDHIEWLQEKFPILRKEISVALPIGQQLAWRCSPTGLAPDINVEHGASTYTWTLLNAPGLTLDPGEDLQHEILPYLHVSTCPSWAELTAELSERLTASRQVTPEMQAWLRQQQTGQQQMGQPQTGSRLAKKDLTQRDTIVRIGQLTSRRTVVARASGMESRREIRPVYAVFAESCGLPLELAALADALVRELGIEPRLALASRGRTFSDHVPGLAAMAGEPWLVWSEGGREWWLSPLTGALTGQPAEWNGRACLFIGNGGFEWKTLPAAPGRTEFRAAIWPNNLNGREANSVLPAWEARVDVLAEGWLIDQTVADNTAALAANIAGTILNGANVSQTLVLERSPQRFHLRMSITGSGLGTPIDGQQLTLVQLPSSPFAVLKRLPPSFKVFRSKRFAPLVFPGAAEDFVSITIELPANGRMAWCPPEQAVQTSVGSWTVSSRSEHQTVVLERRLELRTSWMSPAEADEFRELAASASAVNNGRLFYEVKQQ